MTTVRNVGGRQHCSSGSFPYVPQRRIGHGLAAIDGKSVLLTGGAVLTGATLIRFAAWAAVISYNAWTKEKSDAKDIAETAWYTAGALGLILGAGWLTIQG